jgi:hypothetical protein
MTGASNIPPPAKKEPMGAPPYAYVRGIPTFLDASERRGPATRGGRSEAGAIASGRAWSSGARRIL